MALSVRMHRGDGGGVGSAPVGLHILTGESLIISSNWLTLGGTIPSRVSEAPDV